MKFPKPTKRVKKKKRLARIRKTPIGKLKVQADSVFSKYIIARDKKCVTCGTTFKLTNSHLITRSKNSVRWDDVNCNCQCLTKGHMISTKNGNKDISQLKVGDEICSFEEFGEHKKNTSSVENIKEIMPTDLYMVTLDDGRTFKATGDHRVLTDRGWMCIYDMLRQPTLCKIISE